MYQCWGHLLKQNANSFYMGIGMLSRMERFQNLIKKFTLSNLLRFLQDGQKSDLAILVILVILLFFGELLIMMMYYGFIGSYMLIN